MREAKEVKAIHKDVGWLARTEPRAKEVEFSEAFDKLTPEGKRFIVLHERAHLKTGPDHNARFYEVLRKLIKSNGVSWEVAFELESWNCHAKH
jgi:predicted metal-dependent hydrolase